MKKFLFFAGLWAAINAVNAQPVATFDDVLLESESFYNGSDGAGGFQSGAFWFPNEYVPDWSYWSGFAVSSMRDTLTAGYGNQYSAITGRGVTNSENYAVVYIPGGQSMVFDTAMNITGFEVTNSTLAYLMMRDGDPNGFSKKFGGTQGTDPDFLKLMIWGSRVDGSLTDTVAFFLADYRFDDPEQDYIVRAWRWIHLENLGPVTRLHFAMDGSDKGDFGLNTPAYFCMDNFTASNLTTNPVVNSPVTETLTLYPQPVTGSFHVELSAPAEELVITDLFGRMIHRERPDGAFHLTVDALAGEPSGVYMVRVKTANSRECRRVIKR